MLSRLCGGRSSHLPPMGTQRDAHLEDNVMASQKAEHATWGISGTPRYSPKWADTDAVFLHKTCPQKLITALLTIAKNWTQPRCPSTVVHPDSGLLMQWWRDELSSHEKKWRNLKCKFLIEKSQSEKITHCMIPTIWHSGKTTETGKLSVVARGQKDRQQGMNRGAQEVQGDDTPLCDAAVARDTHSTHLAELAGLSDRS